MRFKPTAVFAAALAVAGSVQAQQATLALINGKVWTENPAQPQAQAVAVDGAVILAVGDTSTIRALIGAKTRVIDLHGRRVTPGFNDAHVHFVMGGDGAASVQLGDAASADEFRKRVGAFAKTRPKGAWLRNGFWDHQRWSPADLPTHQLIDDVTPDNPVLLWRMDGHTALANAAALRAAGIDATTPDPAGGEIVRDARGVPTGILKDSATDLVGKVMPPLTPDEMDAAVTAAMAEAARHGVTSVQNMVLTPADPRGPDDIREFRKLERQGRLTVRIYAAVSLRGWKPLAQSGITAPFGDPLLRIGSLKTFADGALGSMTAWMDAPFVGHPDNLGLASVDLQHPDEMYAALKGADKAGLQLVIHAIGTRANHAILDFYERLEADNGPKDRRPRIEHAQHLRPDDIPRFAKLGVIASMQPYHAIDDGRWATGVIGPERSRYSYAWRSLLDNGAVLAFGSDWPVAPLDPLAGIYAATTRATFDGKNPDGWVPEQRITVGQAVHAYTVGSAYAEFQDKVKGSIEPGKLADLAVLSDDIFAIPPADIAKTRVDITVFDGRVIYQRR